MPVRPPEVYMLARPGFACSARRPWLISRRLSRRNPRKRHIRMSGEAFRVIEIDVVHYLSRVALPARDASERITPSERPDLPFTRGAGIFHDAAERIGCSAEKTPIM